MNTQLSVSPFSQPRRRATRADFSPVRAVRTVAGTDDSAPATTGATPRGSNVRVPREVRLGIELAPYPPSPVKVWPAWHRGALDRLQTPLTRYRE